MKTNLLSLTQDDLKSVFTSMGEHPFRAKQTLQWLYQKKVTSIDDILNLPRVVRDRLNTEFSIDLPVFHKKVGDIHTTLKYAFILKDGYVIETALINMQPHLTLCLSTQVGCKCKCTFCKSGEKGFFRNLDVGEIMGQVCYVIKDISKAKRRLHSIVFMGIGEPLHNYENLRRSILILQNEFGLHMSPRRITVSTAGIVPSMIRLGKDFPNANLAISLNAPTDELRNKLMPINKKYPLKKLRQACITYPLPERKRIAFEYVLLKDVNDTIDCANALVEFVRGLKCKINLIPFNTSEGIPYNASSGERMEAFQRTLRDNNITTTVRESRGSEIHAACGQLTVGMAAEEI